VRVRASVRDAAAVRRPMAHLDISERRAKKERSAKNRGWFLGGAAAATSPPPGGEGAAVRSPAGSGDRSGFAQLCMGGRPHYVGTEPKHFLVSATSIE